MLDQKQNQPGFQPCSVSVYQIVNVSSDSDIQSVLCRFIFLFHFRLHLHLEAIQLVLVVLGNSGVKIGLIRQGKCKLALGERK